MGSGAQCPGGARSQGRGLQGLGGLRVRRLSGSVAVETGAARRLTSPSLRFLTCEVVTQTVPASQSSSEDEVVALWEDHLTSPVFARKPPGTRPSPSPAVPTPGPVSRPARGL